MTMRLRLLQGATALLYMGPLLAGLAGFGWAMLPPFVGVFVLWLMVLRPHQWPQTNREWLHSDTWLAALTQLLSQILLVSVLFGIGRGIGGVLGQVPLFFPLMPLSMSFLAVPLARLVWNAERANADGVTIDELLYPHSQPAPLVCPAATPEDVVRPLLQMAGDCPLTEVGPALEEVLDDGGAWARLAVLTEALDAAPGQHMVLREALVLWATEPENFASNLAPAGMRAAFRVAATDLRLLQRLLPRAAALARVMPERHAQFPDRSEIEPLSLLRLPGQLAADHAALLAALYPRPVAESQLRGARLHRAGAPPT